MTPNTRGLYRAFSRLEPNVNRERIIAATATVLFAAISVALWRDYLIHSSTIYDDRDTAQAQIVQIDRQITTAQDADTLVELTNDRSDAEDRYAQAERQINDMDGWDSLEWKVKNTARLATPVVAVLFAGITLLSIFNPLKVSAGA